MHALILDALRSIPGVASAAVNASPLVAVINERGAKLLWPDPGLSRVARRSDRRTQDRVIIHG